MITIIDYGAGNVKSVENMLKKIGVESILTNKIEKIKSATKLILPGVGHFDYGMQNLQRTGIIETLDKKVLVEKTPILGICLGSQMLGNQSEEGIEKGLGWIDMDVKKFNLNDSSLKVPHMNWSNTTPNKKSKLFESMFENPRFYFVHSYFMSPNNHEDTLCSVNYGGNFVAAVEKENIYGVQFHPEKSHKFGMKLLENFANI
ncbi:MAG: imidazole glycerol phosphate synthase subunit HisH [Flavobacteriales bacterium]|nr:MAG: imidazole glycerol phosphate synthase subunit HisH [Flavobacteriales bacterium]